MVQSDTCPSIVITLSISRRQSVESERVGTGEWCEVPGYTGDTSCELMLSPDVTSWCYSALIVGSTMSMLGDCDSCTMIVQHDSY